MEVPRTSSHAAPLAPFGVKLLGGAQPLVWPTVAACLMATLFGPSLKTPEESNALAFMSD